MSHESRLVKGDKIGVIGLSSPCRRDIMDEAAAFIESLGYEVEVALDPSREYGKHNFLFSSDSAQNRANALVDLYSRTEIKLIMAARGAYGSMEILPLIDWEIIQKHPKPLVGFSDSTAVLLALHEMADIVTYHGPSFSSLSPQVGGGGQDEFVRLLALIAGDSLLPFEMRPLDRLIGDQEEVSGVLIGGNLTLAAALTGTPWQPDLSGAIFFFEDVGVKPYALHRLLLQMKVAGMFDSLAGVLVGRLDGCEHAKGLGPSAEDCIKDIFTDAGVAVFTGAPFGHAGENSPLPLGRPATIDADNIVRLV